MSEFDRRFCGSCQMHKPLEGGIMKPTRDRPRWICKACAIRSNLVPTDKKTKCSVHLVTATQP